MAEQREYSAVVIVSNHGERHFYREIFPDHWPVVTQGSALVGTRADALYVTPDVDTTSDWFLHVARLRLCRSSAPVIQITNLRMSWDDASA